jgi:hypothetical protein
MHHRKPGEVLTGEQISRGTGKLVAIIILALIIVGAGGYLTWWALTQSRLASNVPDDPFTETANIGPITEPYGILNRFMESWKVNNMDYMLLFVRADDRKQPDKAWIQSVFLNYRIVGYKIEGYMDLGRGLREFKVSIEAKEARTDITKRGVIKPKLYLEPGTVMKERWCVELSSAVPQWD